MFLLFNNRIFGYIAISAALVLLIFSTWNQLDSWSYHIKGWYSSVTEWPNANESYTRRITSGRTVPVLYQLLTNYTSDYDEIKNIEVTEPELLPNYHLWSQSPNLVSWSHVEEMCNDILFPLNSSDTEHKAAIAHAQKWKIPFGHSDASMAKFLSNCATFRRTVQFAAGNASKSEAKFPIAYVLLGARNAAQTVRLFRMIYQPQNAYCLAYDNKSSADFKKTMHHLAGCFSNENVFLNPSPEPIKWMLYSILHTVMNCMKILLVKHKIVPWRYVQVLSWNDFPLKSNFEMVEIFKIFNGSQDSALDPLMPWYYAWNFDENYKVVPPPKNILPDGLCMYKGSFATTMSKEFIEFLFTNPTSIRFYQWLKNTKCPEEHYWATIIHNVHLNAPGPFPGQCLQFYQEHGKWKPFVSRYQIWTMDWWHKSICRGQWTYDSCVYGVGDVPTLITRPELVAHKLYEEVEPAALFCMEQWFYNKSNGGSKMFDASFYDNLPSVRYHNMKNKNDFIC